MTQTRITAALFAAVLNPLAVLSALACIAANPAGALPASGVEVPFTERVISTTAHLARSAFAADLDGDGDVNVLSASLSDNKIAWYETLRGSVNLRHIRVEQGKAGESVRRPDGSPSPTGLGVLVGNNPGQGLRNLAAYRPPCR